MKKFVIFLFISIILLICNTSICMSTYNISEKNDLEKINIHLLNSYNIEITSPEKGNFYAIGAQVFKLPFNWTVIFGPITIRSEATALNDISVKFYIDDEIQTTDSIYPYEYAWWGTSFGKHTIKVELYSEEILRANDTIEVFKIL